MTIITDAGVIINGNVYSESDIERGNEIERTQKQLNEFSGMTIDEIYHAESEKEYFNNLTGETI